jgi:hypothetical protein
MPKNCSTAILERWMAMDWKLIRGRDGLGLNIKAFAEEWSVNVSTVKRDLEAFKAMGQTLESYRYPNRRVFRRMKNPRPCEDTIYFPRGYSHRCDCDWYVHYYWEYAKGVEPLFARTLKGTLLKGD